MVAMLLASFSKPVVLANLVAWPLGYIAARAYLDTFQAPIPITPLPFVLSLAITLLIAWLAVGSQTLRAARARPAEVLRYE
jgi:putative ABC transport system permease protein